MFAVMSEESVVVSRGWGDYLTLKVPVGELRKFHIAVFAGGTKAPLPRPTLAAYMPCTAIPDGAEFSHSCEQGPPPHSIKVLIFKSHNDGSTYKRLRALAEQVVVS